MAARTAESPRCSCLCRVPRRWRLSQEPLVWSQSRISSNKRLSWRAMWVEKRSNASGSIIHGSSLRAWPATPKADHCRQRRSRSRWRRLSLKLCNEGFMTECFEGFSEDKQESFRWVLSASPAGGGEQFLRRGLKILQILIVPPHVGVRSGI